MLPITSSSNLGLESAVRDSGLSPGRVWRRWLAPGRQTFEIRSKINGLIGVERVDGGWLQSRDEQIDLEITP